MAILDTGEILIGDHNWQQHAAHVPSGQARGLIPRDYNTHPRGFYSGVEAVDLPTIPRDQWSKLIADKVKGKSQTSDIMRAANVPVLDQNGKGYCWAHSTTGAVMAARAIMNERTIGLSAYSVACKVKNFRDEGGWGAESADFISKNGVCDETVWPQRSMDRSNDNATAWANADQYKLTAQIADMAVGQYDRNLTWDQYVSAYLLNYPCVCDFNWWSHSVQGNDAVDGQSYYGLTRDEYSGKLLELADFDLAWGMNDPVTGGIGNRIRNSWGTSYGDNGWGVIAGTKAVPDGGVGILLVTGS